jgi:anti-sigma factor RsiW
MMAPRTNDSDPEIPRSARDDGGPVDARVQDPRGHNARKGARRDRRLVRFLHGELAPAESRELEAELGRDPALAARLAELERIWRGLEPPAAEPEPMGEGARLARATLVRERRRGERPSRWIPGWMPAWLTGDGLAPAPAWGRPLVAGALAAGLALGLWLGQPAPRGTGTGTEPPRRVAEARPGAPAAAPVESAPEAPVSREERSAPAPIPAAEEKLAAAAQEPSGIRLPASPARPAAPSELEDGALASAEPAFAGEPTLAEAYLQAMEAGDAYDWEGSGP